MTPLKQTFTCDEIIAFVKDKEVNQKLEEDRCRVRDIFIDSYLGHNPSLTPRDEEEKQLFKAAWEAGKGIQNKGKLIAERFNFASDWYMANDTIDLVTEESDGQIKLTMVSLGYDNDTNHDITRLSMWEFITGNENTFTVPQPESLDSRLLLFRKTPTGREATLIEFPLIIDAPRCLHEFRRSPRFIKYMKGCLEIIDELPPEPKHIQPPSLSQQIMF